MSDAPLRDCPACDKPALNKLISAAAFRLKGGGWYETDFKSGSRKNVLDSGTSDASGSSDSDSSSADKKSDSKTDSKSESKSDPVPAAAG